MNNLEELRQAAYNYMQDEEIDILDLAKECDLNVTTIKRFLGGVRSIKSLWER